MRKLLEWLGIHIHQWEWIPMNNEWITFQKRKCKKCGKVELKSVL